MSLSVVFLDETPLSWIASKPGKNSAYDACRTWALSLAASGVRLCVAEVTDYELRRELLRAGKTSSIQRLDAFYSVAEYVPISTSAMREAAQQWANVRNSGLTTAPSEALDGDVILAAQASIFATAESIPLSEIVVATANVRHLARLIQAQEWQNIQL